LKKASTPGTESNPWSKNTNISKNRERIVWEEKKSGRDQKRGENPAFQVSLTNSKEVFLFLPCGLTGKRWRKGLQRKHAADGFHGREKREEGKRYGVQPMDHLARGDGG